MPKNKILSLNSGIQTFQILTNDDKVCIPSLSCILLAVHTSLKATFRYILYLFIPPLHIKDTLLLSTYYYNTMCAFTE